jgi:hypothetical protein
MVGGSLRGMEVANIRRAIKVFSYKSGGAHSTVSDYVSSAFERIGVLMF